MKTRRMHTASPQDLLDRYECGPVTFSGDPNASYERHLVFDHVVAPEAADLRERFEAVVRAVRDLLVQRWLKADATYDLENPKQVYYLSMEFLIGRSLTNNLTNLLVEPLVREVMQREGLDLLQLAEQEPDAGLGNGGLGRLAACFIDSLATMQLPALGYGLRYDYGIFRQEIQQGYQVEHPDNWLRRPDPWEVPRPQETVEVKVNATVPDVIDADPAVRGRLKVLFLPEYNVSLAERLIPASDVSEQISTAGFEASGTSNMKFMMNGALTVGTRDGATIEMAQEAGEENFFLFGLTAEQVVGTRGWYNPYWHYDHEPETRHALDMIAANAFSPDEPGIFAPIWDILLPHGDYYRHLADLSAYVQTQEQVGALYRQPEAWARKALLNVGHAGKFSSDRTIAEYAAEIWQAKPCPVA